MSQQGLLVLWFQEHLVPGKPQYTYEEICGLAEQYIRRHDDEIADLEASKKKPGHLMALKKLRDQEHIEFNGGLDLPDLRVPANVSYIAQWEGELNLLSNIIMARFHRVQQQQ